MIDELQLSFALRSDRLACPFDRPWVMRVGQLDGGETEHVAQNVGDLDGVSSSEHASELMHGQSESDAAHIVARSSVPTLCTSRHATSPSRASLPRRFEPLPRRIHERLRRARTRRARRAWPDTRSIARQIRLSM